MKKLCFVEVDEIEAEEGKSITVSSEHDLSGEVPFYAALYYAAMKGCYIQRDDWDDNMYLSGQNFVVGSLCNNAISFFGTVHRFSYDDIMTHKWRIFNND